MSDFEASKVWHVGILFYSVCEVREKRNVSTEAVPAPSKPLPIFPRSVRASLSYF